MDQHHHLTTGTFFALGLALVSGSASAQQFVRNTTNVPPSADRTENVDFADIDLDGDWDAVFAEGGDFDQAQDHIWLNLGPGTLGTFSNVTATRAPAILDQSRDIEFVDFDNDGDHDLYISNTTQLTPQSNKWWRNTGPGVGLGFYVDETSSRWVGVGAPGSSVPVALVMGGPFGGFQDWSCDCDFGDLDNDGDLDLVHSSYGGALGGLVPTRIFLNNGAGNFTEFNPSGFQLAATNINNGNPGLWCQGTQQANTTNSTGVNCDVASSALDIDVADIDFDFDLDILHGARQELPRMFVNRLAEDGTLGFRDVTGAAFPAGYSFGNGHYDQAMGDQDGDGDTDIYGLNWQVGGGFNDIVMKNNGAGVFSSLTVLGGSGADDNEGDFIDYDLDGDLDILVANFSGQEKMYRNNGAGTYTLMATGTVVPSDSTTTLDADTTDVDNDGDPDLFVANDSGAPEWYLQNTTATNDTFAPHMDRVEQAANRTAGANPTVVRAIVRDNTSYYVVWYNPTSLNVSNNGGAASNIAMHTSQGDIFRGEIPGNLVGTVVYSVQSADQYNNTGNSTDKQYCSGILGTNFCFGDGSTATACPCALPDTVPSPSGGPTGGCANSFNLNGAMLCASGTTVPDTVQFNVWVGPAYSGFGFIVKGNAANFSGIANSDGVRCVDGALIRFGGHNAGTNGAPAGAWTYPNVVQTVTVTAATLQASGQDAFYQLFYRNAAAGWCSPATANWTNMVRVSY
ncbi:MAG: FG-GAP repeat domain-containing protein [Planctomycetota bacterium]